MPDVSTYDVRVYRTEVYKGTRVTTYKVRWKTGPRLWKQPFRNGAQADSYRSSLPTAARQGEAFSIETGRPVSWHREEPSTSWYDLVLDYSAMKWPYASPNCRRPIAEALIDATEVMLTSQSPWPAYAIRHALRSWAFSDRMRGQTEPPKDIAPVAYWLTTSTIAVSDLLKPGIGAARTRVMLDRISKTKNGKAAAANTANTANTANERCSTT